MDLRITPLIFITAAGLILPGLASGSVIFKPGEKAKYIPPGEEEISGNAGQLFHTAQEAEQKGNKSRAIHAYRTIVRKYPKDALAPGAAFRSGQLEEETHNWLAAADAYRFVVERYPSDPHFTESIEGEFRIGEMYLNGKKIRFLGISVANALDRAVDIFASIIRTAPYGKYTARAQFDIGRAREKQGANDAAIQAYQAVVDKFPNDPVAADAQYQIGYIWWTAAKAGTKDVAAAQKSSTAFEDFLYRYPHSEKTAQARANIQSLNQKQTENSFTIAKFYDKQKFYRAAVIYYNEVIRQQPGSAESEQSKKRIDQLRAKVGEAALEPVKETVIAKKKPGGGPPAKSGEPAMRSSSNVPAPLPPAETDVSLPPPASLLPDTTTAPAGESSPAPEASATPEASASSSP